MEMSKDFNELSRVQLPAVIQLMKLGYEYLSYNKNRSDFDPDNNIIVPIFKKQFLKLNPDASEDDFKNEYKDIKLELNFNEPEIPFQEIEDNLGKKLDKSKITYSRWLKRIISDHNFGDITTRINGKGSDFNTSIIHSHEVFPTVVSKGMEVKYNLPIKISNNEYCKVGSYPIDYDFLSNKTAYLVGMSVPPVMTANIATEIYSQWLSKII